ncbi:MAG: hypothetical protein QME51_01485, partial [Planctomycetota bacterium]|nr:hypothetical protein [Planctomycetota bacterium]
MKMIQYILSITLLTIPLSLWADGTTTNPTDTKQKLLQAEKVQLPFIKNVGQIKDSKIKFYTQTFKGTVFITDSGEFIYAI